MDNDKPSMDDKVSQVYDDFAVRHSQAMVLVETLKTVAELTRVFDDITVHKTKYGDYTTGSRVIVWNIEILISEAARDKGGA